MSVLMSAASTASIPSSPSAEAPSGSWRWTTSGTGSGSPPGGVLSWRAGRASVPCMACSARPLSTGGWTRSRSTGSRSASISSTASASCTGSKPTRAAARAAWANGGRRHGAGRDLRRRPGRSKRRRDPRVGARGGLRARRLRLLGVRERRPGAACPDCRLLARRVARQRGGRRPPPHHRPTDRIGSGYRGRRSAQPVHKTDKARNEQARQRRERCWSLPALYAHRLGRAYGPDSSLAALHRTIQQPIDGLETDCCLTADGEPVLLHNPLLDLGTTGSGWAHQRTAAEIRAGRLRNLDGTVSDERPLPLNELLDLAPPGATLQLEVKAHANPALARRTARAVCKRLRDHPARERTEVISFWSGACEPAAELGFRARLVIIADYRIPRPLRLGTTRRPTRRMRRAVLLSRALVQTSEPPG